MILLTRPFKDSRKSALALQKLGHKTSVLPLFEIEYLDDISLVNNNYDAVILTSKHAAKIASQYNWISESQLFIVGNFTAKCSTWNISKVVAQNSDELLVLIKNNLQPGSKILYICGEYIANDFDVKLIESGYSIDKKQVYRTVVCNNIDQKKLDGITKILFYSPRTAKIFSTTFTQNFHNIDAICISQNTANKLNHNQFKSVIIATNPTEKSMFKLL